MGAAANMISSWFTPSSWAASHGFEDLEAKLAALPGLHTLPPDQQAALTLTPAEKQFLESQSGGETYTDRWNNFVRSRQDQESGGGGLFGIEELDMGSLTPIVGGLAMPIGGATGYQAVTGGDIGAGVGLDIAALGAGAGLSQVLPGIGLSTPAATGASPTMLADVMGTTDVPIWWDAPVDAGAYDAGLADFLGLGSSADAAMVSPIDVGAYDAGMAGYLGMESGANAAAAERAAMSAAPASAPWYERLWDKVGGKAGDKAIDAGLGAIITGALRGAPAAAGAYGASQQAEAYKELANKYMALGEPSRARYEASFQPGFSMANEPGFSDALALTTKETLHQLSPEMGNPAGSPNAWAQTLKDVSAKFTMPALNEYRRLNAGAGGLASLTAAAPGAESAGIKAQGGVYDSLGAGLADVFNPPRSLSDILREMRRAGY